jgi:hypothetical protein
MEKEFVPYELALRMKQLGFDEPCFKVYDNMEFLQEESVMNTCEIKYDCVLERCSAPLYQQALRWFREKQEIEGFVHKAIEGTYYFVIKRTGSNESNMYEFIRNAPKNVDTYEEAELACLENLIDIVEKL